MAMEHAEPELFDAHKQAKTLGGTNSLDEFICACASRGLTVHNACEEAAARGFGVTKALARRIAEQYGVPFQSQIAFRDESALREAETRKRRELARRTSELGPSHPHTLMSLSHLANTLSDMGRLEEAEKMYERVVDGRERIYGPDDPDTLRSLYVLAENLQKQGRLGQATTLFERERHGRQLLSQKRAEERLGLRRRTTPAASPQDVAAARRALSGAGLGDGAGDWNAQAEAAWDARLAAAEAAARKEGRVAARIASAAQRRRAAERAAEKFSDDAIARARQRSAALRNRVPDYQSMLESLGKLQAPSWRNASAAR